MKQTHTSPPALESGLQRFDTELRGVCLTCDVEYEEAERGSRENGVQMEPDWPEMATLVHAWVGDTDIYELLSEADVMELEQNYLNQTEEH